VEKRKGEEKNSVRVSSRLPTLAFQDDRKKTKKLAFNTSNFKNRKDILTGRHLVM